MRKVYIVAARRSPIGAFMGSLSATHAADMSALVVKAVLDDAGVAPEKVDELICGNILSAGLGQGVARQAAVKAGIPVEVCAYSLNMLCGSGMKAVMNATTAIAAGEAEIIVAGGVENMSAAPFLLPKETRKGIRMGSFQAEDHMIKDALTDAFEDIHMGMTAENIAARHTLTREAQDDFAIASQEKAIRAVDEGLFDAEIVPIEARVGREMVTFARDESVEYGAKIDRLIAEARKIDDMTPKNDSED